MNRRTMASRGERDELRKQLKRVLSNDDDVLFSFLHGSFINDDIAFGDIDVAVVFRSIPVDPVSTILDLKDRMEQEIRFAHEVDVHILNEASLSFQFHASLGIVLTCKDREALDDFRQRTSLRYWDVEPFYRQSLAYLLEP